MSNSKIRQATSLQEFQNSQFGTVRTVQVNNQPYFVGRDVAIALGYSNPVSAISQHVDSEDSVKQAIPDNQGFMQQTTVINESGLYALVFGSKLPSAKQFKKWVTSEVLPSIRQNGGYLATAQSDAPELIMARALQVAQATIENHKQQLQITTAERDRYQEEVKALAPKAQYTDEVLQSTSTYTFTQMAKELNFTSVNAFVNRLRERKIIFKQSGQWLLTARYAGQGYTTTRTARYFHKDGRPDTSVSTVWTERGRAFLHYNLNK